MLRGPRVVREHDGHRQGRGGADIPAREGLGDGQAVLGWVLEAGLRS